MLAFVVVFVSRFGESSVMNMVAGYRLMLSRAFGFVSL